MKFRHYIYLRIVKILQSNSEKDKSMTIWRKKMSDKNKTEGKSFDFSEGTEIKGGLNSRPSTPRPSQPPKGQSPQRASESEK
jgi:hypothetical protein